MDEENWKVELMVNCRFKWTDRTEFRKNVVIQVEHTI